MNADTWLTSNWTWEQKLVALDVLAPAALRLRHRGDWYVAAWNGLMWEHVDA